MKPEMCPLWSTWDLTESVTNKWTIMMVSDDFSSGIEVPGVGVVCQGEIKPCLEESQT